MDYRRFGDTYLVRLDPKEEVVDSILQVCKKENITLGRVSGFGALGTLTAGVWDLEGQIFLGNDFAGKYEMVSLVGNITQKDGQPYLHAHVAAGDETGAVVGGHLICAVVSATAEISITVMEGAAGRRKSEETGVVILDF